MRNSASSLAGDSWAQQVLAEFRAQVLPQLFEQFEELPPRCPGVAAQHRPQHGPGLPLQDPSQQQPALAALKPAQAAPEETAPLRPSCSAVAITGAGINEHLVQTELFAVRQP